MKGLLQRCSAVRAYISTRRFTHTPHPSGFLDQSPAALALNKRGPFLDTNDGQKEDRQIVIHSFPSRLVKTTRRAHSGLVIQFYRLGLNSSYKKKHNSIVLLFSER